MFSCSQKAQKQISAIVFFCLGFFIFGIASSNSVNANLSKEIINDIAGSSSSRAPASVEPTYINN